MIRIRSFAVFAALFLAGPALADHTDEKQTPERSVEVEAKANTDRAAARVETRRLTTRERWLGTPRTRAASTEVLPGSSQDYILPGLSDPAQTRTQFSDSSIELRSEALNRRLPLPSLGTGAAF